MKRDPEKEQFWRGVIAEAADSGLSVRAFCRQKGLKENLFHAWRRHNRGVSPKNREYVILRILFQVESPLSPNGIKWARGVNHPRAGVNRQVFTRPPY